MTDAERSSDVTPHTGDATSGGPTGAMPLPSPGNSVDDGGGVGADGGPPREGELRTEQEAPEDVAAPAANGPKLVKRVVCSYQLGWLPGDWLQTWRRLDRVFARANLRVKATLAPLEDLPEDTDILVVPPELRDEAKAAAPEGTPILVTPASAAAGAFAELVARLEAGAEFTAEKVDPDEEKTKPKIVSYRGHTIID